MDADTGKVRYLISRDPATVYGPAKSKAASPVLPAEASVFAPLPGERGLRVFAFDPTLGTQLDTAGINEVTIQVPWERDAEEQDTWKWDLLGNTWKWLIGCKQQIVLCSSRSEFSVLTGPRWLAPSESSPQFHQQMVYAVAMRTIRNFENALGRRALWSPRPPTAPKKTQVDPSRVAPNIKESPKELMSREEEYVPRLRIYPHAMREANAYYSPAKKAILFGYFSNQPSTGRSNAETVFTCLSHDIIAHEVTHALLDGMHRRFSEPSNPTSLPFTRRSQTWWRCSSSFLCLEFFVIKSQLREEIWKARIAWAH